MTRAQSVWVLTCLFATWVAGTTAEQSDPSAQAAGIDPAPVWESTLMDPENRELIASCLVGLDPAFGGGLLTCTNQLSGIPADTIQIVNTVGLGPEIVVASFPASFNGDVVLSGSALFALAGGGRVEIRAISNGEIIGGGEFKLLGFSTSTHPISNLGNEVSRLIGICKTTVAVATSFPSLSSSVKVLTVLSTRSLRAPAPSGEAGVLGHAATAPRKTVAGVRPRRR